MGMKKIGRIDLRGTPEEMDSFRSACENSGVKASSAIRDLCHAAVEYVGLHKEWPKKLVLQDGSAPSDIPMSWLSIALSKVKSLDEFKDILLTVLMNAPYDWASEIGPNVDHSREVGAAIDARLKIIRK